MPWFMYIYVICLGIIVLSNVIYWLIVRQKFLLTCYEFFAGAYLIFVIMSYWFPFLKSSFSAANIPAIIAVISLNFYFSVLQKRNVDIKQLFPEIDDERAAIARDFSVIEIAKAFPVLLAAPAYVIGAIQSIEFVKGHWTNLQF